MTLAASRTKPRRLALGARLRGVKTALVVVLVLVAQLPLLRVYALDLWGREHYQFFPLLLGAVAVLAWQRWPRNQVTGDRGQVSGEESLLRMARRARRLLR